MNTDQMIEDLVVHLKKPSESHDFKSLFWLSWFSSFLAMAVLTYLSAALLPEDIHLPLNLGSAAFWFETLLWSAISFTSAWIAFRLSRPQESVRTLTLIGGVLLLGLVSTLLLPVHGAEWSGQLDLELHWMRGPCGLFIFSSGAISLGWLFFVLRKGAPVHLRRTGAWAALSMGSLASMFMHLVCTHETGLHTLVWHIGPLLLLTLLSVEWGRFGLRW